MTSYEHFLKQVRTEFIRDYEATFQDKDHPSPHVRNEFIQRWTGLLRHHGMMRSDVNCNTIMGLAYQIYLIYKESAGGDSDMDTDSG